MDHHDHHHNHRHQAAPVASHSHNFLSAGHDDAARRTTLVVALTAVMMIVEIIAGYLTGSMALLADGFHMATHAGALGVAALAYRYARRHVANPRFSFGTGKVGDLAGFASALVLAMIALGIAVEAVIRLANPTRVNFGDATLVAVVGLIVNLVSALLLGGAHHHHGGHAHDPHDDRHHDHAHDHRHDHVHGHGHDNNLRAAYLHVLADALTSVLAIVALLAGRYLGWVWMDPAMGIVGAFVITRWSMALMRETSAVLLDVTDQHVADEVRELVEQHGDARLTDLHVWRVGPQVHAAVVEVESDVAASALRERLQPVHEIAHLTVAVR